MPKGFLVKLPMGTGKTRRVLSHILHGVSKDLSGWNRRLKRTVILGPNPRVKKAWYRELLLLALYHGMLTGYNDEDIRQLKIGGLEKLLKKENIAIPRFLTFAMLKKIKKPLKRVLCHYLVLDEWHNLRHWIHEACSEFIDDGTVRKWFIGGRNVLQKVYFVSATPVNPVLETEVDIDETPYDDEKVKEKIKEAITRATDVIQAFTGRRDPRREDKFQEIVDSLGITEICKSDWKMPSAAGEISCDYEIKETELCVLHHFLQEASDDIANNGSSYSREYAYAVGLIRTKQFHRHGPHFILREKKGRKQLCFGAEYRTLHYPLGIKGRGMNAAKWLCEYHTRIKRLRELLVSEKVFRINGQGGYELTGKKALIFCTHVGVTKGLVKGIEHFLGNRHGHHRGELPEIGSNIGKSAKDIEELEEKFRSPGKSPYILIVTDAMSESIDLHEACKLVVHYELPWSISENWQTYTLKTSWKTINL